MHYYMSDLHLGHRNILKFGRGQDFNTLEEHDQYIIDKINATVHPTKDQLSILGDLAFNSQYHYLEQINCRNVTVYLGNHDYPSKVDVIRQHLPNVKLAGVLVDRWKNFGQVILSHMPVHPSQLESRARINVHGHMHNFNIEDPRYFNVSMEQLRDYTPISRDQIIDSY